MSHHAHSLVHVTVTEDDEGRLPAQLQRNLFQVADGTAAGTQSCRAGRRLDRRRRKDKDFGRVATGRTSSWSVCRWAWSRWSPACGCQGGRTDAVPPCRLQGETSDASVCFSTKLFAVAESYRRALCWPLRDDFLVLEVSLFLLWKFNQHQMLHGYKVVYLTCILFSRVMIPTVKWWWARRRQVYRENSNRIFSKLGDLSSELQGNDLLNPGIWEKITLTTRKSSYN